MLWFMIIFVSCIPCAELYGTCFRKPSFVSNWTEIVAQNASYSEITIYHGLGEIPAKVDVQVKAVFDNGTEDIFMFSGIASAQRDDDNDEPYGGVVYIYNKTTVTLIAPNKMDGHDTGKVVYTGGNVWAGPTESTSKKGLVKIRVWASYDFPVPEYQSDWIPVQSGKAENSVIEITHKLGTVPKYVSLQVRDESTNSISDGIGSWLGYDAPNSTSSWGGVLYGYDEFKFRIYLPSHSSGKLFSAEDGWGISNRTLTTGLIKLTAWKSLSTNYTEQNFTVNVNLAKNEKLQTSIDQINVSDDLIQLVMIPRAGVNEGFHYKASGAAQSIGNVQKQSYGGLVYSYSDDELRMYHPPFPKAGKPSSGVLLDISGVWGNGTYTQNTSYVNLLIQIWSPEWCEQESTELNNKSKEENGLSTGAAVGIVLGVFALLGGSFGLLWALLARKKKKNAVESETEKQENQDVDVKQSNEDEDDKQEETNKSRRDVQQTKTNKQFEE